MCLDRVCCSELVLSLKGADGGKAGQTHTLHREYHRLYTDRQTFLFIQFMSARKHVHAWADRQYKYPTRKSPSFDVNA